MSKFMLQNINYTYSYQNIPNTTIDERYKMVFNAVTRPLMSWRDEVLQTARNIKEIAGNKPIILCLSSGIDSEVAALAFIECNIEFTALTFRHIAGTNKNDLVLATQFCSRHNIQQEFVDFDHVEFFNNGYKKYSRQGYRSTRIFRYFQLLLLDTVENMGGVAVLGGGDQRYYGINNNTCVKYVPEFNLPLDWCINNNTIHFPYFYKQNPHVFASYMKEDLIEFLLDKPEYFPNYWAISLEKTMLYHSRWPSLVRRRKLTGFENFYQEKLRIEADLTRQFPDLQVLSIPVATVKNQLGI